MLLIGNNFILSSSIGSESGEKSREVDIETVADSVYLRCLTYLILLPDTIS